MKSVEYCRSLECLQLPWKSLGLYSIGYLCGLLLPLSGHLVAQLFSSNIQHPALKRFPYSPSHPLQGLLCRVGLQQLSIPPLLWTVPRSRIPISAPLLALPAFLLFFFNTGVCTLVGSPCISFFFSIQGTLHANVKEEFNSSALGTYSTWRPVRAPIFCCCEAMSFPFNFWTRFLPAITVPDAMNQPTVKGLYPRPTKQLWSAS